MALPRTENDNDSNSSSEISGPANENELAQSHSNHNCNVDKVVGGDGAIKEEDEAWDELCIGFWSQNRSGRNDWSPGHCKGISILRAESEIELQKVKSSNATGIRIIFITSRDETPHSPLRSGGGSQTQTGESKPLSGSTTLQELLTEKAKDGLELARTLATDDEYKKKIQASVAATVQQEMQFLSRITDKITSGDLPWRVLVSAQQTVTSGLAQAVDWVKGNGGTGNS